MAIGWRPQLRWAADVRDWSPRRLRDLLAINRWLGGADQLPVVPLRERSVQLFGDEKRLGALLSDPRLFGPDRLTLDLVRARRTSPPFIARTIAPSRSDALDRGELGYVRHAVGPLAISRADPVWRRRARDRRVAVAA